MGNDNKQNILMELLIKKLAERKSWRDYIIPILSLVVAFVSIVVGYYIQKDAIRTTRYGYTFSAQKEGYTKLLTTLDDLILIAKNSEINEYNIKYLWSMYYDIELLLPTKERKTISDTVEEIQKVLLAIYKHPSTSDNESFKQNIITLVDLHKKLSKQLQVAFETNK